MTGFFRIFEHWKWLSVFRRKPEIEVWVVPPDHWEWVEQDKGDDSQQDTKTLVAELRSFMYRIDLSQIVNKYIGETEKNLKKVFNAAEECGAILLFDEADALFGKRTEVKDAHDRYANREIGYLLERMERFKGLAVLATNRKKDLDAAYLRRIRYVIRFPFPDKEEGRSAKLYFKNSPNIVFGQYTLED